VFKVYAPINSLNFYIPHRSLDAFADDAEVGRISELNFTPGVGVTDKVLAALGDSLLPAFSCADQVNKLFIDHVTTTVVAHIVQAFGGTGLKQQLTRGGLAVWQERRVKEFVDANLDGDISVMQLASVCGLSGHHFSRAFRRSTRMTPHQWLLRRRVDQAKHLLRNCLRVCPPKSLHEGIQAFGRGQSRTMAASASRLKLRTAKKATPANTNSR